VAARGGVLYGSDRIVAQTNNDADASQARDICSRNAGTH
jgi:hypothetical protein